MLYIFLTGQPPFNGVTDQVILAKVKNGKFSLELKIFETISADAIDLLKGMLTYDPEKRLSAKEALQHPWFKKVSKSLKSTKRLTMTLCANYISSTPPRSFNKPQ